MKDSKNIVMIALCMTVALMAVAYAAFSQSLTFNGTGTIDSKWGPFHISGCSCTVAAAGTGYTPTASCAPATNGGTTDVAGTITFNATAPGDKATCTFTVKNAGTLHAAAPTFSVSSSTNFTIAGSSGTCIKPNNTGTFVATVTYNAAATAGGVTETQTLTAKYVQTGTCA